MGWGKRRTESLEVSLSWKLIKQGTNDATVAWTGCIAVTIQIRFLFRLQRLRDEKSQVISRFCGSPWDNL